LCGKIGEWNKLLGIGNYLHLIYDAILYQEHIITASSDPGGMSKQLCKPIIINVIYKPKDPPFAFIYPDPGGG